MLYLKDKPYQHVKIIMIPKLIKPKFPLLETGAKGTIGLPEGIPGEYNHNYKTYRN